MNHIFLETTLQNGDLYMERVSDLYDVNMISWKTTNNSNPKRKHIQP